MKTLQIKYFNWPPLCMVVLLLFNIFPATGQSYVLTNYSSKNGISHDNVRQIVADSSGFIWMATWDGLTRYDGTDFVNYFHDPADSTTIPYFSVRFVVIDALDNLWIATDNGILCLFDRAREEFREVRSMGGHSINDLVSFISGPDGNLWLLLRKGMLRYDPATGETFFYRWPAKIHEITQLLFSQYTIVFDGPDHLWLAGPAVIEAGLIEDQAGSQGSAEILSVSTVEREPGRNGLFFFGTGKASITRDTDGSLWVAATTGLFRLDSEKKVFREFGGKISDLSFADTVPVVFYRHGTG
ncbi:MAG: two-component regulator propeller domain-containing protein, partial [Bacteroidales bacterium]